MATTRKKKSGSSTNQKQNEEEKEDHQQKLGQQKPQRRKAARRDSDVDRDYDSGDDYTDPSSDQNNDFADLVQVQRKRRHVKPNSNQTDPFVVEEEKPVKQQKQRSSKAEGDKKQRKTDKNRDSNVDTTTASDMNPPTIEVPRPKGSPFSDAISPNTLQFLAELKENNNRDFMRINQERWQSVRKEFMDFVGMISTQLHEMDPTIMVEEPKHAIYRQNRDLRFTNDLRPYKTHLSASFSRGGKKSPFAGYHISIAPGNETFVAAGIWQPAPPRLFRIRQGIMDNASLMHEALSLPQMDQVFGKHGLQVLEGDDKLKTAPKNVPKDHPEIELLRYKSLVISKTFTDLEVVSEGFLDNILDTFEAVIPFVAVLNSWTG